MTKIYPLIHLNGFVYAVDKEAVIPQYAHFWASDRNSIHDNRWKTYQGEPNLLKMDFPFYHLIVMSSNPSLGLSLLPAVDDPLNRRKPLYQVQNNKAGEEGNLTIDVLAFEDLKEAEEWCGDAEHLQIIPTDWIVATKAKKYSEEDMIKGMLWAMSTRESNAKKLGKLTLPETEQEEQQFEKDFMGRYNMGEALISKFLQSLNPLPIAVEVNTWLDYTEKIAKLEDGKLKEHLKRISNQPKVDANNYVNILKWIYE